MDESRVVEQWSRSLARAAYAEVGASDARRVLTEVAELLIDAAAADSVDAPVAQAVSVMVRAGWAAAAVVPASRIVFEQLPDLVASRYGPESADRVRSRTVELALAFGRAYAAALERRALDGQQALQLALSAARRDADNRFRAIFDQAPMAIVISDLDGRLLSANPTLDELIGSPGESLRDRLHPDDREETDRRVRDGLTEPGATVAIESRFRRTDGRGYAWMSFRITRISGGVDRDYHLGIGHDVTEHHRIRTELHHQGRHDALTGLPNRLMLIETLHAVLVAATAADRIGLCFLDLDGFKQVNDRYGHRVGDRLLIAVAARLAAAALDHLVARIGGDEFVVLLVPPVDEAATVAVATGLLDTLTDPFVIDGHPVRIAASVGVFAPAARGGDPEELLDMVDSALYRAKAGSRGGIVVYNDLAAYARPDQGGSR